VQVDESRSVLLRDYIAQERRKLAPHFRSLSVAVSHLNYTVKALPPAQRHNDVYHACLCCAAEKKKSKKDLLHDVSFYLKPGQMTIMLGAPGCGKSTLIKLLANRLRGGKVTGELTFNGKDPRKGNFHQDIAYVPQDDVHIGTYLTYLLHSTTRIPFRRECVRVVRVRCVRLTPMCVVLC
jgi:ABC-type multidrug transport system fused ATPase/permease subunit